MVENTFDRLAKRLNQKADIKEKSRLEKTPPSEPIKKEAPKAEKRAPVKSVSKATTNSSPIKLPSGEEITIEQRYIDTSLCRIWEGNNRLDESRHDGSLEELKNLIEAQGQMVPGFVRPIKGDSNFEFEVIYGSRRFAACQQLGKPFLALVGNVADKDALIMMDAENNARKEMSVYEKAVSYQKWLKRGFFKDRTELSAHLGISPTWLSRIQAILKLPEEVLSAFQRKTDVSVWWAVELLKIVKASESSKRALIETALKKPNKIQAPEDVYAYLLAVKGDTKKAETKSKKQKTPKIKIQNQNGDFICDIEKAKDGKTKVVFSKSIALEDIKEKIEKLYSDGTAWEF